MEIDGIEFPDDCLYEGSGSYLWAKHEGDDIKIGLTNLGLALAGDIVYIELPGIGDSVTGGEPFGVVETNDVAADDPSSLADESWFIVVKSTSLDEDLANMMDASKAKEYFTGEIERAKGEGLLE